MTKPTARALDPALKGRIALPFLIVTLIWGSTWLVIHSQFGAVPTLWSVSYRFFVGAAAMFVVVRAMRNPVAIGAEGHALAGLLGLATFCINYNLVYAAERHITSGLVAVTFSLLVPSNALLARLFLGQSVSRPFLAGSAVAMLGVGLLFLHELAAASASRADVLLGIGLTLVAVFAASIGNVMQSGDRARRLPTPSLLAWGMLWGAAIDALVAGVESGPPVLDTRPSYIAGLLYLGVIASALAFTLYFNLIRRIGAARGGYVNVLIPVIAMALSTVFEHYRWSVAAASGGGLAVLGLALALWARAAG